LKMRTGPKMRGVRNGGRGGIRSTTLMTREKSIATTKSPRQAFPRRKPATQNQNTYEPEKQREGRKQKWGNHSISAALPTARHSRETGLGVVDSVEDRRGHPLQ